MNPKHRAPLWETVWMTLAEPRMVTAIHVAVYLILVVTGALAIAADQGQLPIGVWSARMMAAGCFVVGGLLGAPTAWAGAWWLERAATMIVGFGALSRVIAVAGMGDYYSDSHATLAVGAWLVVGAFMWVRYLRVRLSPYRPGAGPLLPQHEASLAVKAATDAERRARD